MAPSSPNTSNHQRIARALNSSTGCGYQRALQRVKAAADAGRLPARLDQAGRDEAVRMLTESHPQPIPAPTAAASAPPVDTKPSAMMLGLVRGGLDKTVAVSDVGTLARQGHQVLPVDLGDLSPTELLLTVHGAMERRRALQQKERVVEAMRAERDRKLNPFLLPAVPEGLREQVERLAAQTRQKPRSGGPR
ncbi:hypothetical protein [Streptomyces sp. A 4/2]|uniref:hypothetical protein n=1 Tax=Streptomyces sp. A 4/2 TaxID=2934314 RepID=UPI0020248118|nr:hypothetical protein [Streptomyces sp. A 4/2]